MLQFEELKLALDELKPDLSDLEEALDLKAAGEEIEKLEAQAAEPEFWNDMSHSQKILQRTSTLKNKVSKYNALKQKFDDIQTLIELGNDTDIACRGGWNRSARLGRNVIPYVLPLG